MIDRIDFIRGAIASVLALLAPKPTKAVDLCEAGEPAVEDGLRESCGRESDDGLWPNENPYPCHHVGAVSHLSRPIPSAGHWAGQYGDLRDCSTCRANYNRFIVASDPEWYGDIHVVDLTGHWWSLS